ncbi:phage terminase small subunit P27 family [Maliponia aquimaris]|uniref:Phage terminase, small subunit n=1 Tax=Maliponia aquimaris TaxID=1673631 RepID=A0A238K663_9RHOB|nr:phage terminase small subunit P27 family [Maliponia aquimaris]SMX37426.1 Phage terminase, small subunit [Maliponia aquimaris]
MARKHKPKPHTLAKTRLSALPRCPDHLSDVARKEWRRLATPMVEAGLLTLADRAALAAYCQAYGRWVEAEERLKETPALLKAPSGYVQQSPWLTVANKQLEIMGRFMSELGLTPVARTRIQPTPESQKAEPITFVWRTIVNPGDDPAEAPIEHVRRLTLPGKDD